MSTEDIKSAKYLLATITLYIMWLSAWLAIGYLVRNAVNAGALENFF